MGEAIFECENSLFQFGNLGGVLFFILAFCLTSLGFGSFLLFAFAWGGGFFGSGGVGGGLRGGGLGVGELLACSQSSTFGSGARFIQVVLVIAGVRRESARTNMKNGGGHGADEVNIVADKDEGSLVLPKSGN